MSRKLSPYARLEHGLRQHVGKWLFRQHGPESGEVFLHQRRVFIVPTHPGLLFFATLVTLFIASVNYNLSLGFGFTFLLASCAFVDMHLTFRNLAHLHLTAGRTTSVFTGEEARFELHLINRRKKYRYAIWLDFVKDDRPERAQAVDVAAHSSCAVTLSTMATKRGWLAAPKVRLQTRFPLGLLRAWSYWQPDAKALVYPRPEDNAPPLPLMGNESGNGSGHSGQDDFAGIRGYRAGDSIKRLAWRQIARIEIESGSTLVTKQFEGGAETRIEIDFSQLPSDMEVEAKLSRMTRWVLEAEARGHAYAFHLGELWLPASCGPAHREICLQALALYGNAE